ncbi:MAG: hypothetical protein ACOVMM_07915 [Chitinophagaceae bacterium]
MKKKLILFAAIATFFTACNSHTKKVVIAYKGKTTINEKERTIEFKDGAAGGDKEVVIYSGDKATFTLNNEGAKTNFDIVDDGYYLINARPDTLIGSFQNYGAAQTERRTVTQDMMLNSIDSLKNLVANKNISEQNKNFFILPFSSVKVTSNPKAVVIAPFHQISTLEQVDGKAPEVYQFWTINEIRAKIEKQMAIVDGKPAPTSK